MLDLGCGNGTTAIWLAGHAGCRVTGIDLSGVRIDNAKVAREKSGANLCATDLPSRRPPPPSCPSGTDSSAASGARRSSTTCPTSGRCSARSTGCWKQGGIFVFDDLVKPKQQVSEDAQKYVYDRLLYDTEFSFESYQEALKAQGFEVLEAEDISGHLRQSYLCLADRTPKGNTE